MVEQQYIDIKYYDGLNYQPFTATLSVSHNGIIVRYQQQKKFYDFKEIEYIPGVGEVLPAIELPDEARIEFLSHDMPSWLNLKNHKTFKFIHSIERSYKWVLVSFIGTLFFIFSIFKWGIPWGAYWVAYSLPSTALYQMGDEAEEHILKMTDNSQIPQARQQHLIRLYQQKIVPAAKNQLSAKIIFRSSGSIGANALAIPNNTIIVTDELIEMAQNDQEILAVLAHEQGHLQYRHSLQQVIQGLGIGILYVLITGDANNVIVAAPVMLTQLSYSRKFELQADKYAIDTLKSQNISPQYLADFLARMEYIDGHHNEPSFWMILLRTHPDTQERIEQVKNNL